jgi:uncharacterized heparinase superfamily protein
MTGTDSLSRARLFFSTARHLSSRQIWTRANRILRTRWWSLTRRCVELPTDVALAQHKPLWLPFSSQAGQVPPCSATDLLDRLSAAQSIAAGRFRFLAREREWSGEPDWNDASAPQLWRYHLHYFDYILDLAILAASGDRATAWSAFRRLATSWIRHNERLRGDGWHPYTVSRRIVNFCHAISVFAPELATDPSFASHLARSTYGQLRYLFANIEHDVRGNHIIENARALIHGGIAFEGEEPKQWLRRGMKLLETEVDEQLEPDGGHFERTPAYHVVVLRDLLEIAVFLRRNRSVPSWLDDAIARMLDFLASITMPDGELPLIKDTTLDGLPPYDLLAAGALHLDNWRWKQSDDRGIYPWCLFGDQGWSRLDEMPTNNVQAMARYCESSGFAILRDERRFVVIDVGRPCPDYLPAHAHADLLSFELAIDGARIIVDSGVYEYDAGPWRDFFRSTRAHNTVEIGGVNQSEVWSSFRVAHRALPRNVHWDCSESHVLIQAEHDGYRRLSVPVTHRRTFVTAGSEILLVIDEMFGEGTTHCRSFLHAHPVLDIVPESDSLWRIGQVHVTTFGVGSARIQRAECEPLQGWYSDRFGVVTANSVLTMERSGRLPFCFGYAIGLERLAVEMTEDESERIVRFASGNQSKSIRLPRHGGPRIETF